VIALFDTNSTSYWRGGVPKFKIPLAMLFAELNRKNASLAISTVTLQEMLIYSRHAGVHDQDYQFLTENFQILPFDEPCALAAARLAAEVGSPNRPDRRHARGGSASQEEKDCWQRDAAIAGTAEHYSVGLLVTTDGPLSRDFGALLKCPIHLLREVPLMPSSAPQPPSGQSPDDEQP
jgi:predicted nucleic acid-binding protein